MKLRSEMMDKSSKIYLLGKYKNKFSIPSISLFYITFGTIFIAYDLWHYWTYKDFFNMFFISLGSIFIIFGLYYIFRKNKLNI